MNLSAQYAVVEVEAHITYGRARALEMFARAQSISLFKPPNDQNLTIPPILLLCACYSLPRLG